MVSRYVFAGSVVALSFLVPTGVSHACGNVVFEVQEFMVRSLKRAEKLMEEGKLRAAVDTVKHFRLPNKAERRRGRRAKKIARKKTGFPTKAAFMARRANVLSLASIRSQGEVNDKGRRVGRVKNKRLTAMRMAAKQLIRRLPKSTATEPRSPREQVMLAEAHAALDAGAELARLSLRQLHADGLMPTAWGYATLARLEHAVGMTKERDEALAKCTVMSLKPAVVCPKF